MSSTTISSNKKIPSIDELPEKELTQLKKKLEKKEKKNPGSTLTDCPACAVKALAQFYWGIQNLNAGGVPDSLPFNNAELDRVHQVNNMLRQFTPGADTGAGNAQEDPEEMQTRLLTACLESVNYQLVFSATLDYLTLTQTVSMKTRPGKLATKPCSYCNKSASGIVHAVLSRFPQTIPPPTVSVSTTSRFSLTAHQTALKKL
jgi:hypothetical protein